MKFKAYHKIRQFKDVVRNISFKTNYKGKDDEGNPIYEDSPKPVLTFKGTVKLHGTNAMVYYTPEKGIMAGKRTSGLSPEQLTAHMGFNQFVQVTKKEYFTRILKKIYDYYCGDSEYNTEGFNQVIIYGEWAGKGIQKGVAISELNKSFFIFDCKIVNTETDEFRWLNISSEAFKVYLGGQSNIYNITDFPNWEIEIDFNNPELSQNKLIELTTEVEKECPVAKQLGVSGIGEGIVWKTEWKGERYIFKVKGEKHSTSKLKTLASVDSEVLKPIQEFVSYACTINRIEQGIQETEAKEKSDILKLLKWVANDIISEEDDALKANNLEWKQVAKECSNRVRQYFFNKIDKT
jgi:hypothetical protein